jgi:hypothetical protein
MPFRSKLFHSIVTVGLAMTAGCGGGAVATRSDASAEGSRGDGQEEGSTPGDASPVREAAADTADGPFLPCSELDAATPCPTGTCRNEAGFERDDAGCCFPCYV